MVFTVELSANDYGKLVDEDRLLQHPPLQFCAAALNRAQRIAVNEHTAILEIKAHALSEEFSTPHLTRARDVFIVLVALDRAIAYEERVRYSFERDHSFNPGQHFETDDELKQWASRQAAFATTQLLAQWIPNKLAMSVIGPSFFFPLKIMPLRYLVVALRLQLVAEMMIEAWKLAPRSESPMREASIRLNGLRMSSVSSYFPYSAINLLTNSFFDSTPEADGQFGYPLEQARSLLTRSDFPPTLTATLREYLRWLDIHHIDCTHPFFEVLIGRFQRFRMENEK